MLKRSTGILALALLVLSIPITTQAAFTFTDYQSSGDRLVLQDSSSGLDWLSLSQTEGMSYNDVIGSSTFSGWRYATGDELYSLFNANTSGHTTNWNNYGGFMIEKITRGIDPVFKELIDFFTTGDHLGGLLEPLENSIRMPTGHAWETIKNGITTYEYMMSAWLHEGYRPADMNDFTASLGGHYLVRESAPTPIPGAVWLLGSGLVGLVGVRRKMKA